MKVKLTRKVVATSRAKKGAYQVSESGQRFYPIGHELEHPDAWFQVRAGNALPADQECIDELLRRNFTNWEEEYQVQHKFQNDRAARILANIGQGDVVDTKQLIAAAKKEGAKK